MLIAPTIWRVTTYTTITANTRQNSDRILLPLDIIHWVTSDINAYKYKLYNTGKSALPDLYMYMQHLRVSMYISGKVWVAVLL